MDAVADFLGNRREEYVMWTSWSIQPENDKRGATDLLERKIDEQYEEISKLMHERNKKPQDPEIRAQLDEAFRVLRQMQEQSAESLEAQYRLIEHLPTEESNDFKRAMELVKFYEAHPPDDAATEDTVHEDTST